MVARAAPTPVEQARALRALADRLEREDRSLPTHVLEELAIADADPAAIAEVGLEAYLALLPKEDPSRMLDLDGGTPVSWVDGRLTAA